MTDKKEMAKVSIIIPVYNSEKYIRKCLNSIRNQTYKNYEVIVLNDGSKDNSLAELKKYKQEFQDFNLMIIDKENEGIAKTRNKGIELSSGKYLMFIDNDDYIDNDYIGQFVNNVEDNDLLIGGHRRVTKDGKKLYNFKINKNYNYSKYRTITPWARIYKSDFIKKNNIKFLDYGIGEDAYFNLNIIAKGAKIKTFKYIGYNWVYNNKSISNTKHKDFNYEITILLDKILELYPQPNEAEKYFIYKFCIWYIFYSGKNTNCIKFMNEYEKLVNWMKQNNVYKINFLSKELRGERIRDLFLMIIFRILEKFKLIKFVSKIYCKG